MATRVKFGTLSLNNSTGFPVAGGAATDEANTPWVVRSLDWTPQSAAPLPIWGGGPPFTPGRQLAYQSYDDVTERIPLLLDATSHDDAANELQLLRQEIGLITQQYPVLLEIKPSGSTNSMHASVKNAWIQEAPDLLIVPVAGALRLHVNLMIVRSPFFGLVGPTGETVINAQSIAGQAWTGSPDNRVNFTTGSGDLISEGQPLNLTLTNATGSTISDAEIYLGTIANMTLTSSAQSVTTSSTTGANAASGNTITVGTVLDATQALKMRLLAATSSIGGSNVEFRLKCYVGSSSPAPFYTGPWIAPQANSWRYDAGTVPSNLFKSTGLSTMYVLLEARSTNGASASVTLSDIFVVYYYTLCKISGLASILNSTGVVHVRGFAATSGRALLPLRRAEAYLLNSGSQTYYGRVDGVAPVYIANGLLWLYTATAAGLPLTTTFTATAIQAPLWRTFRGQD